MIRDKIDVWAPVRPSRGRGAVVSGEMTNRKSPFTIISNFSRAGILWGTLFPARAWFLPLSSPYCRYLFIYFHIRSRSSSYPALKVDTPKVKGYKGRQRHRRACRQVTESRNYFFIYFILFQIPKSEQQKTDRKETTKWKIGWPDDYFCTAVLKFTVREKQIPLLSSVNIFLLRALITWCKGNVSLVGRRDSNGGMGAGGMSHSRYGSPLVQLFF